MRPNAIPVICLPDHKKRHDTNTGPSLLSAVFTRFDELSAARRPILAAAV